jgi:hypothetical protein
VAGRRLPGFPHQGKPGGGTGPAAGRASYLGNPSLPAGGWAEGRENGENVKEIGRKGNRKEKWSVKVENNVNRRNINNKKVSEELLSGY